MATNIYSSGNVVQEDVRAAIEKALKDDVKDLPVDGLPRLQSQDSLESADSSPEAAVGVIKTKAPFPGASFPNPPIGLQRQLTLGSDASEDVSGANEDVEQNAEPPMLFRQDTLFNSEEGNRQENGTGAGRQSGSLLLQRQDTLYEDELLPGAAAKGGNTQENGTEAGRQSGSLLLQRQDTLYEDELLPEAAVTPRLSSNRKRQLIKDDAAYKRQNTLPLRGDDDSDFRAPSIPLTRMHSLMDAEELLGKTPRAFYEEEDSERSPTNLPKLDRVSPSTALFSPPSISGFSDQTMARQAMQKNSVLEQTSSTQANPNVFFNDKDPLSIKRQESWKEDVSDAGWRAW